MQQFPLLPVLPFRDWEEDVFQDLTVVPLVLIPSTSVTASWSKSQSQKIRKLSKSSVPLNLTKIQNLTQFQRRQNTKKVEKNEIKSCTCASASLDSWKSPHWPGSSGEGGTPEAGKGILTFLFKLRKCLFWSRRGGLAKWLQYYLRVVQKVLKLEYRRFMQRISCPNMNQ